MSDSKTRELLQRNGPGGYDIWVDPAKLRVVSAQFQSRLQAFAARHQAFAAGTPHQDGEFGKLPLPETHHVNDQYRQTQQDAVKALEDLATWLSMVGGGLTVSADIYDKADGV
jgi:hypothetical protein